MRIHKSSHHWTLIVHTPSYHKLSSPPLLPLTDSPTTSSSPSLHLHLYHHHHLNSLMATIATMAMFNAKSLNITPPTSHTSKPSPILKPISLLSLQNLPKGLTISKPPLISTAIAGAIFSTLSHTDAAFAAQQVADIAEGDNRGLALLLPLIPAILWVLYNILRPALNQLERMRSEKGFIVGLGLGGGLAAAGFLAPGTASADELAAIADASSSSDSRGLLLLFVVTPAILWVLYNILPPALNQINKMRSG